MIWGMENQSEKNREKGCLEKNVAKEMLFLLKLYYKWGERKWEQSMSGNRKCLKVPV